MLGMAQKQEITFAMQVVRPAGLRDDIVHLGPVLLPTGLQVSIPIGKGGTDTDDIMNVFRNVRWNALTYVLIWMYITTVLVAFFAAQQKTKFIMKLKRWTSQWLNKVFHFTMALVAQESLASQVWAIRFVCLSFSIAIFVAVSGFLLNLIQTDGVVEMPPKWVEYFYDLIHEPEFKDRHLMIFTAFHFYDYLLTSTNGTLAYDLFTRMVKTDNCSFSETMQHCSFLKPQISDMSSLAEMLMFMSTDDESVSKGRRALLIDKSIYDIALHPAGCIISTDAVLMTRNSKDFVVSDYATIFYSKTADKHLMKYVNHRTTSIVEAGMVRMLAATSSGSDYCYETQSSGSSRNTMFFRYLVFAIQFSRYVAFRGRLSLKEDEARLCQVAVPDIGDVYHGRWKEFLADLGVASCNVTFAQEWGSGFKRPDGNYTGMLGMAQRKEITMGIQLLRPGSLEDEVVKIGPVLQPTGLMVISTKGISTIDTDNDILNVFTNITLNTLAFYLLSMFMVVTILASVESYRRYREIPPKLKKMMSQWLAKAWHCVIIVVDQEGHAADMWTIRLIWYSCCLAVFVLVFGYLLNLIQTDGVVERPAKRIEHVHDLIHEPEFKDTHIMIITALHFYEYLRSSANGTIANILYQRMAETDQNGVTEDLHHTSFLDLKISDPPSMLQAFSFMMRDVESENRIKKAILIDVSMYDTLVYQVACVIKPKVISRDHRSRDFVVADYATFFFSRAASSYFVELVRRKGMTLLETGNVNILLHLLEIFESNMLTDDPWERFRCLKRIPDDKPLSVVPSFVIRKLVKTTELCVILLTVASLVFLFELARLGMPRHRETHLSKSIRIRGESRNLIRIVRREVQVSFEKSSRAG
ncbi:hypothetical protein HDE_11473 [Halotydeus destructor]|nr:hypothetical protein HDE_11473 [Halotydeus destructor]